MSNIVEIAWKFLLGWGCYLSMLITMKDSMEQEGRISCLSVQFDEWEAATPILSDDWWQHLEAIVRQASGTMA